MSTFWPHDNTPSKRGRALILEGGQWVPYEAFNRELEQLEQQDKMNRFPYNKVNSSGFYWYRHSPAHGWSPVYIEIENEVVITLGNLSVPRLHRSDADLAELYGPIPLPPDTAPLDSEPLPF